MYCLRSWLIYIWVMESRMTAPSHYLKQCGLIFKLINNVLWHLSQWIIITDLKIPISKMRLKLVCWDNFTPSPEIINLFGSDNSFVCVMVVSNIFFVTIFNPSGLCPLKGTRYHAHVSFVTTPQGGNGCPKNTCCMKSVTWKIMTSVKAKIWKWLVN